MCVFVRDFFWGDFFADFYLTKKKPHDMHVAWFFTFHVAWFGMSKDTTQADVT